MKKADKAAVVALVIIIGMVLWGRLPTPQDSGTAVDLPESEEERINQINDAIVSGGPPKDGIPPVDDPKYLDRKKADGVLKDSDVVFGIKRGGQAFAFPQEILVWHEIVNDEVDGEKISVTYCPLTGSAIGFPGASNGYDTTYGTSGKLANSCLVMYDRATDSYWPQILGRAVRGPRKGKKLPQFHVVWTSWGRWKGQFPGTEVLSRETGYSRAYGDDPYGSYQADDTYYQEGGPLFSVLHESDRFPPKEVMVGIEDGRNFLAVPKDVAREEKLIETSLGGKEIVVIYSGELDDALAYERGGRDFTLQGGEAVDGEGNTWNVWGEGSNGERLEPVNSFNTMWYAWYAFYPDTEVYEG